MNAYFFRLQNCSPWWWFWVYGLKKIFQNVKKHHIILRVGRLYNATKYFKDKKFNVHRREAWLKTHVLTSLLKGVLFIFSVSASQCLVLYLLNGRKEGRGGIIPTLILLLTQIFWYYYNMFTGDKKEESQFPLYIGTYRTENLDRLDHSLQNILWYDYKHYFDQLQLLINDNWNFVFWPLLNSLWSIDNLKVSKGLLK